MKKGMLVTALAVLGFPVVVFAGGAANMPAMRKQQQETMKQQVMMQQTLQQKARQEAAAARPKMEGRAELLLQQQADAAAKNSTEIADLNDVLISLKRSARDWPLIIDMPAKEMVISYFIDQYRQQKVQIRKAPQYYATMIDEMSAQTPQMLEPPFDQILRIVATLEYDFDNGQNKDAMVRQILGSQDAMLKNRQRLGLPTSP